ncbi:MAG: VOC family protein [Anaerolineales bacterium]|nr:VOC family protein [Anaerolineales bacterium]
MIFTGIHHVTAITADAQANVDFYEGVLGLRLVKRTVNHNDARTLHLFYGDRDGTPGSLLTFFVWPGAGRGRQGGGRVAEIGLAVSREQIGFWMQRLLSKGIRFSGPEQRDAGSCLTLDDPDGLPLVLVGLDDAPAGRPWPDSPVPADSQSRGIHHVTFWAEDAAATGRVLERHLGLAPGEVRDQTQTYPAAGLSEAAVAVRAVSGFWPGADGAGVVHHVAFRAPDAAALHSVLHGVRADGLTVSEVREHGYFQSVYFSEPGGALIEVATDRPGLTLDEPPAELGQRLTLPPDWESRRAEIEAAMPGFTSSAAAVDLGPEIGPDLGWIHRYEPGIGPQTLLLLHGTGADETQLLGIGRQMAPSAHLLSVRGRSLEEGAPRFFRRYTATAYDQDHLLSEARALTEFVAGAAMAYRLAPAGVIAVGYSNGANIALTALSHWPHAFGGAILIRPVMVMEHPPASNLAGLPVLVLNGRQDPFLPYGRAVLPYLQSRGARVDTELFEAGHELTMEDVRRAADWLRERTEPPAPPMP